MTPSPAFDRQTLRTHLRQMRAAYVAEYQPHLPFPDALRSALLTSRCVGGYMPMTAEADPRPILLWCVEQGITTALPYLERGVPMRFKAWSPDDAMEMVRFGYEQPLASAPDVIPDLFLVPLVGFDSHGNRMGQGAGYYDRYFEVHPAGQRIGIAWECQRVPRLDVEPWDVPLHAMLTDTGWHDVTTKGSDR